MIKKGLAESLFISLFILFCVSFLVSGNFDHLEYDKPDFYGLRVCPENARHDYCDIKRDIIWRLKRNKYLWGSRCRGNLRSINATICGAVLKGSYEVCHEGDPEEMSQNCHTDCQILSTDAYGDCTVGNKPRDRCICYSNRTEEIDLTPTTTLSDEGDFANSTAGYETETAETPVPEAGE